MRYIRFIKDTVTYYGILDGEKAYVLEGNIFDKYKITDRYFDLHQIKLLAPCCPSKIVAVGINYKAHAAEMEHDLPEAPMIFIKPATTVIAHEESIVLPDMSEKVDYEAELALVIGKTAKNIRLEDAGKYIFGATCLNDVTARDLQKKDGQWTRAKSFDTFAPLGPYIVTGIDYSNVDLELVLNGEVKQKSNTSLLINDVYHIVSYISQIMTLLPGDVIATGTPSGIGKLSRGDVVEVRLEGIGVLRNNVV